MIGYFWVKNLYVAGRKLKHNKLPELSVIIQLFNKFLVAMESDIRHRHHRHK
jgi:hypothetical protein